MFLSMSLSFSFSLFLSLFLLVFCSLEIQNPVPEFAFIFLHPRNPKQSRWPLASRGQPVPGQWIISSLLRNDTALVHCSTSFTCPPQSSSLCPLLFVFLILLRSLIFSPFLFQFLLLLLHLSFFFPSNYLHPPFTFFPAFTFSSSPSSLTPPPSSLLLLGHLLYLFCLHLAAQLSHRNRWKHYSRASFPTRDFCSPFTELQDIVRRPFITATQPNHVARKYRGGHKSETRGGAGFGPCRKGSGNIQQHVHHDRAADGKQSLARVQS